MKDVSNYRTNIFESIKQINEYGSEYWSARDLSQILEYKRFDKFKNVIEKAEESCGQSDNEVPDHFSHVGKMIDLPKGAKREIEDIFLSRYACYLIVQNADPSKEVVALGQTYFTIQTRRQEISDKFDELNENQKRLAIRDELKSHNKQLADVAKDAGVTESKDYAIFQNFGYMGLYGGLKAKDIHKHKKLKSSQKILDHMGSTELAANLFRATQTEEKLIREKIKGKGKANQTHFIVGKKVRDTIDELGGTMPEDLPTPEKSVKQIRKEEKKIIEK